jgi:ABC-type dipeptide/oligopeptide/nickel transport system permease component
MAASITRRALSAALTLLGVSVVVFALVHLVPGDPVKIMLGDQATPEAVMRLRHQLGLDASLPTQYLTFLGNLLHGNLGTSVRTGQPVLGEIEQRLPSTLALTTSALAAAIVLGIVAGVGSAVIRQRPVRAGLGLVVSLGMATPTFCVGILLLLLFGVTLGWFPIIDDGSPAALVLPAVTLALPAAAYLARLVRSGTLEVLGEDYIRTARAKGAPERRVLFFHALRNALLPVVTVIGLQFGALITGATVVEIVFSRPGLGAYAVTAIKNRDFPQIQGTIMTVAAVFIVVNLAVDLLYPMIDARARTRARHA